MTNETDPSETDKPSRLLVAEDNAINRKVISMQMDKLGIRTDMASDGSEAIEAWKKFPYPIIFMDCQMPEVDGFEATARIRQLQNDWLARGDLHETQKPYIVALTANALKGDRERCLEAGMDDYLSKPARPEEIQKVLARWANSAAKSS